MTDEERMRQMALHVDRLDAIFADHMRAYDKLKKEAALLCLAVFQAGFMLGIIVTRLWWGLL